ncbi:MAG: OmpA family protein [Akkermansiaceae bacterium]|nr:OmpA family protein [Verrucomicrobiales bacterium]
MKSIRFFNLMAIGLVLSVAAVGCRKKPVGVTNIPNQPIAHVSDMDTMPPINPTPGPGDGNPSGTELPPLQPLGDPSSHANWPENAEIFKAYTVHFAYDSSALRSAEKAKVASVADYLKANARDAVRVDGHCDERGTEEYNRSLGERRALAVREELIRLGIDGSRIDTKSFGEDQPSNPGHDEAAWNENRRGEFVLLSAPK